MTDVADDVVDDFLAHYGVRGMKWGIRKESSNGPRKPLTKKQKLAVAGTAAAGVTAIVAGAFIAARYNVKLKDMKVSSEAKAKAEKILETPTDYIYVSKPFRGSGTRTDLKFVSKGQTKDFFTIFDKAGLNDTDKGPGYFRKMDNGDVAAVLSDMFGRVDDAFRPIPHIVLIPANKASGLNSIQDVIEKHGPELEKRYLSFVEDRLKNFPNV